MRMEAIINFIEGNANDTRINNDLKNQISKYIEDKINQKDSISIKVEQSLGSFNKDHLAALLNKYLKREILEWDLEYLLVLFEFSFDDMCDKSDEVIFNLSDPYLNYPITSRNVKRCLSYLKGANTEIFLEPSPINEIRPHYRSIFKKDSCSHTDKS